MKIEILAAAEAELNEAFEYYNDQSEGLGYTFVSEIKQTIARIVQAPDAWPKLSGRTSRCRARRFPYGILYQKRDNDILIVAIMHLRRHPDSWKSRIEDSK